MFSQVKKWMLASLLMLTASLSQAAAYEAGKQYKVLENPLPVLADGKIHVEEAFWYGCPHCFHLESILKPWKKDLASDVAFSGVPAMFGRAWVVHAQLYHVADVLGILPTVHEPIFRAIHIEKKRLLDRDDQRDFLVEKAGIAEKDFDKAYESFTVKSRMKQADQRIRAFKISGVPALIVQGKYVVDASSAGGQDKMLDVVDYLIAKERLALKAK